MDARNQRLRIVGKRDGFRDVLAWLALLAAGALLDACQETPATTGGAAVCTYGQTVQCGPANACTATCLPDLSAYGPCVCDAGADASDAGKKDAK